MQNQNEKRNVLVIALILIGLLICFGLVRYFQNKEQEPEQTQPDIVEPSDKDDEEDSNPSQSEDDSSSQTEAQDSNKQDVVNVTDKEEEVNLYPVISIEQDTYTVEMGNNFALPKISSADGNGDNLIINITYMFKPLGSSEYTSTLDFDTNRLGTYKVTYKVENSNHYTATKDIYIEVVDSTSPIIEAIIERYNSEEDIMEYIALSSGAVTNNNVYFSFRDNDQVVYAEYYNSKVDNTIFGDTLEQEAMPTVIEVDVTKMLTLTEEGEYHVRAYDRSGNVSEFVVTIDETGPVISVNYEQISDDEVIVTVTANEKVEGIDGWGLSSDGMTLTKVYQGNIDTTIKFTDEAGNTVVTILNYQALTVEIVQDNKVTTSTALNSNDGEIKLNISKMSAVVTYTFNNSEEVFTYNNNDILTNEGYYSFTITDGAYTKVLNISISSMGTED